MLSQFIISTFNLAGLMALIAISFVGTSRFILHSIARQMTYGLILGAGAVLISLQPLMHVNGIQNDPRNLFVGCAAAIFGPVAGIITFLFAAATRYHEAAPSANVCVTSLFVAGCAGLVWRECTRDLERKNEGHFVILGLTISMSYLSTFLLPREDWHAIFTTAVPLLTIGNVVGAVVLGSFLGRYHLRNERERMLLDQASLDPLTGLMNRRAFEVEYATRALLPNGSSGTAFIIMDLDHFKTINDTYGHKLGDQALVGVSEVLKSNSRASDLSARFGGDEFVLCLPDIGHDQVARAIRRIQEDINAFGRNELDLEADLTVSVGVCWRETPVTMDTAYDIADKSLYRAKADGRNQMVFGGIPLKKPERDSAHESGVVDGVPDTRVFIDLLHKA